MQSVKYGVGPVESTRGKTSSISLSLDCSFRFSQWYSKIHLKELIFRSYDGNTATPLADKRETGRFMCFPVPY